MAAGDEQDLTNSVFAFDANTGDVRWSRWPVSLSGVASHGGLATDHVFVREESDGNLVGFDLDSGDEVWRWRAPSGCGVNGNYVTSPDVVLVPVFCGELDSAGSYAVIGVDDREGSQRWRTASPTGLVWEDVELTTSADGRATRYQARLDSQSSEVTPMLLDSATGAVRYRAHDRRIVAPDLRTPVLQREVPGLRPN